jgi:ABC-2 type transport system permease protein
MWLWITLLSVRSGAGVIAEDFANKAFQFYFAKPVIPVQYLVGRAGALALTCFALLVVPTLLTWVVFMATSTPELRLERAGLLLPLLLYGALVAAVVSAGAIGCSSLSKSRALTISAWILIFIVPHVIAWIVDSIADWPWLYLLSIPGLLATIGDELFKVEAESALRWWHAAPVLAGLMALGLWGASERVKRAEVIT